MSRSLRRIVSPAPPSNSTLSGTFEQVVVHLRRIAEETAGSAHDAPQALIAVIDVSGVAA